MSSCRGTSCLDTSSDTQHVVQLYQLRLQGLERILVGVALRERTLYIRLETLGKVANPVVDHDP